MNILIITNNPKTSIEKFDKVSVQFYPEATQMEILIMARDYIHKGAKLVIHPMMGRVKPHETPYKSVVIDTEHETSDFDSILMIEDSIAMTDKYLKNVVYTKYYDEILEDLQLIDLLLLKSGIAELEIHKC